MKNHLHARKNPKSILQHVSRPFSPRLRQFPVLHQVPPHALAMEVYRGSVALSRYHPSIVVIMADVIHFHRQVPILIRSYLNLKNLLQFFIRNIISIIKHHRCVLLSQTCSHIFLFSSPALYKESFSFFFFCSLSLSLIRY